MFRDASGRAPRQLSETESLFSIIGTLMGNNAKQRGEAKDAQALSSLYAPIEPNMTDTTFQDQASRSNPNSNYMGKNTEQKTMQGLLPTGFQTQAPTSDMIGQGLLGQPKPTTNQQPIYFANPSTPADIQPAVTPAMGKYSQANNPANVSSVPKDWNGIQKDINKQGYERIKEMAKTMSPEMLRAYLPEANRLIKEQIATSKGEYDKNLETQTWERFDSAKDYKTKMSIGIRGGLKPELLKLALDNGIKIQTKDVGDKFITYGEDTHNNRLIDLKTGEELDPSIFVKGISAEARLRNETTIRGQNITRDRPVGGSRKTGGLTETQQRASDQKLRDAKAIMGAYSDNGESFINKYGDNDYRPYSTAEQVEFNKAADYIKAHDVPAPQQQQEVNPDDAAWYDQTWRKYKSENPGMTDRKITDYMTYLMK